MKKTQALLSCAIALLVGCGGASAASSEATTNEAPTATQAQASTWHLGEWVMEPPIGQERYVSFVRFALATPPAIEAFQAMKPSAEEEQSFYDILRLRQEDSDSPRLQALRRKLDELEGARVTFLPQKLISTTAAGTEMMNYRVEEDLGNRLVILEEGSGPAMQRRRILAFDGQNRMVLTIGATRVPMTRVPDDALPTPNEVPPTGGSSADHVSEVPRSGDTEYDACVAEYYRCIEQLSAADREALAETLAYTKQVFADAQKDPVRMNAARTSCRQAIALAHATYCE